MLDTDCSTAGNQIPRLKMDRRGGAGLSYRDITGHRNLISQGYCANRLAEAETSAQNPHRWIASAG